MQNFNEYYNKQQVLRESLMKDLAVAAVAIVLGTVTGSVFMDSKLMKDIEHVRQELFQAKQQGYDVQEIIDKSKQPEIRQQALQIIKQAPDAPVESKPQAAIQPKEPAIAQPPKQEIAKSLMNPTPAIKHAPTASEKSSVKSAFSIVANVLKELGKYSPEAHAVILANIRGETGKTLAPKAENMNYSPERLLKVFPKKIKTLANAKKIAMNPEDIANIVYGGRLGNAADEGYKYRGRGFFQLTGKESYKRVGDAIGEDLVNNPDLVNEPSVSKKILKYLISEMIRKGTDLKSMKSVTARIGPAQLSQRIKERTKWYSKILPMVKKQVPIPDEIP